jgi:hypothetical protein
VPLSVDDTTLQTIILVDGVETVIAFFEMDDEKFGVGGYFVFFLFGMSMILLMVGSKEGVLFSIIITLAGSIGLGIIKSDLVGIGASGLWLLIVVFASLWKINKEKQQ